MEWLKDNEETGEIETEESSVKRIKARSTPRAKGVLVALPLDVSVALSRLASERGEPVTYLIEQAVKEYLTNRAITWWKGPLDG